MVPLTIDSSYKAEHLPLQMKSEEEEETIISQPLLLSASEVGGELKKD